MQFFFWNRLCRFSEHAHLPVSLHSSASRLSLEKSTLYVKQSNFEVEQSFIHSFIIEQPCNRFVFSRCRRFLRQMRTRLYMRFLRQMRTRLYMRFLRQMRTRLYMWFTLTPILSCRSCRSKSGFHLIVTRLWHAVRTHLDLFQKDNSKVNTITWPTRPQTYSSRVCRHKLCLIFLRDCLKTRPKAGFSFIQETLRYYKKLCSSYLWRFLVSLEISNGWVFCRCPIFI